jgi:hypothetical protein
VSQIPFTGTVKPEIELDITKDSPVFDFPSGRSHFIALTIPESLRGRDLILRTFVGAPVIAKGVGGHNYFFPVLTYLDSSRNVTSTLHDEKPRAELYGWSGRGAFTSIVSVPRSANYVVIHTPDARLGELYVDYTDGPGFTAVIGGTLVSFARGKGPVRAFRGSTGTVMFSEGPK